MGEGGRVAACSRKKSLPEEGAGYGDGARVRMSMRATCGWARSGAQKGLHARYEKGSQARETQGDAIAGYEVADANAMWHQYRQTPSVKRRGGAKERKRGRKCGDGRSEAARDQLAKANRWTSWRGFNKHYAAGEWLRPAVLPMRARDSHDSSGSNSSNNSSSNSSNDGGRSRSRRASQFDQSHRHYQQHQHHHRPTRRRNGDSDDSDDSSAEDNVWVHLMTAQKRKSRPMDQGANGDGAPTRSAPLR
ncbi:hypothetical protein THASP1DRAFT_22247 [Thamnocephalis sphaerospora]|uniref:Uncharacterized protein n=1 Tax=Thamnocephalis sphaerospora TaxID=78915 RepID=A0A4V1IX65_9FUNG|nr:hypothetical protein THASP1DRAFT_22247 [Thamnocephalis sphaerospora]|eukprot:RKP09979.1 hypothetical protein THASP1DRAFT_22247 [Thamnocephalis sphaerospora]